MSLPTQKKKVEKEVTASEAANEQVSNETPQSNEVATTNQTSNEVANVPNDLPMNNDELFDALEQKDDKEFTELSAEYLTFEEGQVLNFICAGIEQVDRFDGEEGKQDVVALFNREKKKFICAATILVNAVNRYKSANPNKNFFPLRITCTGKEKGKNGGHYFVLKVATF